MDGGRHGGCQDQTHRRLKRLQSYRLVGSARRQVEAILTKSEREFGTHAQTRYADLILLAFNAIASDPGGASSKYIEQLGLWRFHLSSARKLKPSLERVRTPHHVIIYRIAATGMIEILGLAHDRQDLLRAARRIRSAAKDR